MPGLDRDLVVEHRLPIKEGYKPYNLPPRRREPAIPSYWCTAKAPSLSRQSFSSLGKTNASLGSTNPSKTDFAADSMGRGIHFLTIIWLNSSVPGSYADPRWPALRPYLFEALLKGTFGQLSYWLEINSQGVIFPTIPHFARKKVTRLKPVPWDTTHCT